MFYCEVVFERLSYIGYPQFVYDLHPQTSGQVEQSNRTLKAAIPSYFSGHPTDWDL